MAKVKGDVLKDPILRKIVEVIVKEIDPDKIILFGSRARGDYNEHSDYDILVLKRGVKPEERRKVSLNLLKKLINLLGFAPVDIIVQDTSAFQLLKDYKFMIYHSVDKEGVIVYERKSKKVA